MPAALGAQRKPTAARPASPSRRAPRGTVAVGDTVRDSLVRSDLLLPAESTYAQQWRLPGRRGETVTIDLLSDAFDAYLFLVGPGRSEEHTSELQSRSDLVCRLLLEKK